MKNVLYIILFIATFTFSNAKWDYYNDSNSIIKGGAYSIVVDYNNTVWVSTGGGLVSINGDNWTKNDSTDSDYVKYATELTIDNYGNLWFVSNGRVVKYEDGNFIKIDSLYGAKFIEFDSKNNYWVASSLSIFKHEGDKFIEKYRGIRDELEFTKLIINGKDNIYFSRFFYSDLCQLKDDSTIVCFDKSNSEILEQYSLTAFATDSSGNIWTGGRLLIQSFDGEKWKIYDSLKTNDNNFGRKYTALGFDKNNSLWALSNWSMLSNSYLFKIDKKVESYILDTNLLGDEFFNPIYDLAIDFNGNVWLVSPMGLFKFTPELTNIKAENKNDNRYNISYGIDNIGISSTDIISKIEIFDLMGSTLFSLSDIDNYEYTVNTASFTKGLYILRVNNTSYKFLKR